ncbi:hypothetical protein E4U33_003204 [Claviceps sp. LM78 group G4]|nr:hypothetical protein E4U33_003204 [Claviceps sp. LM78 group G4]
MLCDWTRLCFQGSRNKTAHDLPEPIEEAIWADRLKYFHPTQPGQILDGRFKTIAKLGYGRGSTVWLAENLECKIWSKSKLPRYVCIKITAIGIDAADEKGFLKIISNANPSHEGLKYIRVPLDVFNLQGENGTHSCLVFEPMGETLYIKDDNIMTSPMTDSEIKSFAKYCKASAQPRYIRQEDGRVTYVSHEEIIGTRGIPWPRLADFNTCFRLLPGNLFHSAAIQSNQFRAQKSFLASHGLTRLIYGILMWNLLGDTDLFDNSVGEDGIYDAHVHLAQMISQFGKPPALVVKRERLCRENKLGFTIVNSRGKECETMNEYWGGPFFDDEGCMIRKELIKEKKNLPGFFNDLTGKDRSQFVDLVHSMVQWLPESRKTAAELLQHPFFIPED